ncbi:MAG: hypothetical protein KGL39_07095 [Patescibacteria group bacterium]|nr:hypothetical protein [Patescibacteria group bacterium]
MKTYPGMLTALSFSGGKGSTAVLAMVLDGVLPRPQNFIVCNADPGMENTQTYDYVASYERECVRAGIPFLRTKRNLFEELLLLKFEWTQKRFDTPPLWTRDRKTGKKGRLLQKCTQAYKIAPMDRAIRGWMEACLGVSSKSKRLAPGTLVKYIGFSADEWHRIKETKQKYVAFDYPLINRNIANAGIADYFKNANRPLPPRSVCNACFANDVPYFREMFEQRPTDWEQAVAIDESVRDLTQIGIKDECFVSSTLVPLRRMAELGFHNLKDEPGAADGCHSGHCFI